MLEIGEKYEDVTSIVISGCARRRRARKVELPSLVVGNEGMLVEGAQEPELRYCSHGRFVRNSRDYFTPNRNCHHGQKKCVVH